MYNNKLFVKYTKKGKRMKNALLMALMACVPMSSAKASDDIEIWVEATMLPKEKMNDLDVVLYDDHLDKIATIPYDKSTKIKIPGYVLEDAKFLCTRRSASIIGGDHPNVRLKPNAHYRIAAKYLYDLEAYGTINRGEGCDITITEIEP